MKDINSDTIESSPAFSFNAIDEFTTFGMSFRDYFAARALQGLLGSHGLSFDAKYIDKFATTSYQYADAMLRAREKS